VNLPSPRDGLPSYNLPTWDGLWAACVDHGGDTSRARRPRVASQWTVRIGILEAEMFFACRRGLWQMFSGGAFERFPSLVLVLTGETGRWMWTHSGLCIRHITRHRRIVKRLTSRPFCHAARANTFEPLTASVRALCRVRRP